MYTSWICKPVIYIQQNVNDLHLQNKSGESCTMQDMKWGGSCVRYIAHNLYLNVRFGKFSAPPPPAKLWSGHVCMWQHSVKLGEGSIESRKPHLITGMCSVKSENDSSSLGNSRLIPWRVFSAVGRLGKKKEKKKEPLVTNIPKINRSKDMTFQNSFNFWPFFFF